MKVLQSALAACVIGSVLFSVPVQSQTLRERIMERRAANGQMPQGNTAPGMMGMQGGEKGKGGFGSRDTAPENPDLVKQTMTFGGQERFYYIDVPKNVPAGKKLPVIFVIHGGGGNPARMSNITKFADHVNGDWPFIAVFPASVEGTQWNDGRKETSGFSDDMGFLKAVVSTLIQNNNADPARIYTTGISNGGMMSLRLVCEAPDVFAAAVPVAASIPVELNCNPGRPVSVVMLHGTDDPLIPYNGGELGKGQKEGQGVGGHVIPVEDTFRFWMKNDDCTGSLLESETIDKVADDETSLKAFHATGCKNGTDVTLYKILGGGHTWPGGGGPSGPFMKKIVGVTTQEINATDVALAFFRKQGRGQ